MLSHVSPSSSQQHLFHHYHPPQPQPPPPPSTSSSTFLNEQFLLSAAAIAASHSYPPSSSFFSSLAASNLLSSINAHIHSISPEQQITTTDYLSSFNDNYNEKRKLHDHQSSPIDVKNLIGSSLTAIGLDNVNEDEFDKAATNEQNNELLLIGDDIESFERSTTPATNNTSPIHSATIPLASSASKNPMTRPVNIPNSFTNEHFSHSSSAKSPFDAPNQLFHGTLGSVS
jgi:hypothetical protein